MVPSGGNSMLRSRGGGVATNIRLTPNSIPPCYTHAMSLYLYRWVDCLNVELARPRQLPNIAPPQNDTTLCDSDEEVFVECMNRANLHN